MNLCTWNVRGLNELLKVAEVKQFIRKHSIKLTARIETRVKSYKSKCIEKKFDRNWSWVNNTDLNPRGRIWLGWN